MKLSRFFLIGLLVFILQLKNSISANQVDFPTQACASAIATQNYWTCAGQLGFSVWKLHRWGEDTPVNICGIQCHGNLKGRISKWQWKWDGRFQCPSIIPGIVGHDTKKSRDGAMEWAIKDFLNKAMQSGRIKPEQFNC